MLRIVRFNDAYLLLRAASPEKLSFGQFLSTAVAILFLVWIEEYR